MSKTEAEYVQGLAEYIRDYIAYCDYDIDMIKEAIETYLAEHSITIRDFNY
jgi:hypothetical protein